MKFIIFTRLGDIIFIFGHVSQLKQAVFRTIVEKERREGEARSGYEA